MRRVAEHWDAMAPRRMLHVRYEDLVRDQVRRCLGLRLWALPHPSTAPGGAASERALQARL